MVRKCMLALAVLCLTACGCQEERLTAWGTTGQGADLNVRVGVERGNTEAGAVLKYLGGHADEVEPDAVGGYLIFHLTQDITIEDEPPASPIYAFLESLHARPYAGLEIVGAIEGDSQVRPNFILGTSFRVEPLDDWALVVEYSDGDGIVSESGDSVVTIGGRLRF